MSSEVWEHFLIDLNDSSFAKCNFCSARISRGGKSSTTSALKKHLKRHSLAILRHNEMKLDARSEPLSPIEVVCVDDPPPSACSSSSSNAVHSPSPSPLQRPSSSATPFFKASKRVKTSPAVTNQPTLSKFIDSKEKFKPGDKRAETITKLIAEMICLDNQPFVIVENKGFRALINHLESRYVMPSRKVIANEIIPRMYAKTYATVKKLIADAEAISFTTDLWTSTANDDYMGLTAHFIDSKFVLRHICLDVMPFPYASHSAENIKQFICETLESWDITENVVAFVRDNGRNVVAALNASGFEHIPCLAHTLQLVIKYGLLNTSELNSLLPTCRKVVGHFKHSSHSTKILKAAQVTVGAKMHRLVQDEPTRWNSTLHMLKRLLEQRQAITLAASDLHVPAELSLQTGKKFIASWIS